MADQAGVHSIEALEQFRSALVIYRDKALASLHEISYEVTRTRHWLHDEQMPFWNAEIRRIQRDLEDAQQRLFSASISDFRDSPATEERDVRRMRERKRMVEEKLQATKIWARQFDTTMGPLAKPAERLHTQVEELATAIHALAEMIKRLEAYAGVSRPRTLPPAPGEGPGDAAPEKDVPHSPS